MPSADEVLAKLIVTLKGHDPAERYASLTGNPPRTHAQTTPDRHPPVLERFEEHLRQAPLDEDVRGSLLAQLSQLREHPDPPPPALLAAADKDLTASATMTPDLLREPVVLGPMPPVLNGAFITLIDLDRTIDAPWSLVGGLMVAVHAAEGGHPAPRATTDADIAVNVFTASNSLRHVTSRLVDLGFEDDSPVDERKGGPSYRYVRDGVKVDVLVPEKANAGKAPPRTVTGRLGVEMWGMQSAIKRTQRVPITFDGTVGHIRRPDLLGAVVVKSAAAIRDTDNGRHLEDLAHLCNWVGVSPDLRRYITEITPPQRARLRKIGSSRVPWRISDDPEIGREAFAYLLGDDLD